MDRTPISANSIPHFRFAESGTTSRLFGQSYPSWRNTLKAFQYRHHRKEGKQKDGNDVRPSPAFTGDNCTLNITRIQLKEGGLSQVQSNGSFFPNERAAASSLQTAVLESIITLGNQAQHRGSPHSEEGGHNYLLSSGMQRNFERDIECSNFIGGNDCSVEPNGNSEIHSGVCRACCNQCFGAAR